ncbi:transposase [Methylomonas koyamae]|uniref:transposase n=1 Tax=Methylomonas TaxID=416 RepID=UPI000BC306C1|nr:transposase [Methylomonas koyamae]ATG92627.1 Transposase IS3/IS911 family protein [Methylomonas koyamae]
MKEQTTRLSRPLIAGHGRDGRCLYDPEAKRELVRICLQPGLSVAKIALEHGINANLLRKWIGLYQEAGASVRHGTLALPTFPPTSAQLAGLSTRTSSAQPNKWKKQGMIFAINHGGVDYFPDYRLDSAGGLPPIKVMAKIIGIFRGHRNSILDSHGQQLFEGNRPQNLLPRRSGWPRLPWTRFRNWRIVKG